MRKYVVRSMADWQAQKRGILGINQEEASLTKEPRSFPCVVVAAYLGEGWDEIDFVYLDDLTGAIMSKNIDVESYEKDDSIPGMVTQDRSNISIIISEMLDSPDNNGIYPTTIAYNKLEKLIREVRIETVGRAWAEACCQLDRGEDPRKFDLSLLIEKIKEELILEWKWRP